MLPDVPKTLENRMSLPTNAGRLRLQSLTTMPIIFPSQLLVDQIMPGIYLTNDEDAWTPEKLRSHGFTHIIYIDKHIKKYIQHTKDISNNNNSNNNNIDSTITNLIDISTTLNDDFNTEFEKLDLNFGEESYLTTVLPNCYKAVKFIDKALQNGGAILVIDRNNNQKCLTIVIGYLMYKNNINFNDAFQKVKKVFKSAELERFFISQLYEYEPILQVQRAQARGHSCSREIRSAFLKRKKLHDDCNFLPTDLNYNNLIHHHLSFGSNNVHFIDTTSDVVME